MYEAILAAIRDATNEASAKGWAGYELQAHVFLAAFNAYSSQPAPATLDPQPEPMVKAEPAAEPEIPGVNSDNGSA